MPQNDDTKPDSIDDNCLLQIENNMIENYFKEIENFEAFIKKKNIIRTRQREY